MPKKKKHDSEELYELMSFLAETVAEMSDDQIREEFAGDPEPKTKEIFRAAIKDCKMEGLRTARAQYESASMALSSRSYNIPQKKPKQRALLASIFSRKPDLRSMTAQHRDLKDLTDSDVESFLKQLAELGLLDSLE
ncbi:MAG: hypothetical protein LAO20_11670 [Acidobacteriia bacterium]|nr:hypothetical protein [Terriglobia bacterium]